MSVIRLDHFGGMQPAIDDRLLPQKSAAYSRDAFLYTGALLGWRDPKALFTLVGGTTRKAYRIPQALDRAKTTDPSYWLEFADADTDIIRSPAIEDSFKRYYFASPSQVPRYNTTARIGTGDPPWLLGVPAPGDAPSVSPGGGVSTLASARSYVYTYLTEYGEEGPPSDFTFQNGLSDDTWTIGITPPDLTDQGVDRNITKTRIYRTIVGTSGTASFFLVAEVDCTTTSYADTLTDAQVAQAIELQSTNYFAPPTDLKGFIAAPNGMVVGFRENEIWFCEPFKPHAWPSIYTISTEFPVVGLGVAGQAIVACTLGYPVIMIGNNPNVVTETALRTSEPCTCKGSILSTQEGVFYTSPNGLIQVTPYGQVSNVTLDWITRDQWAQLAVFRAGRAVRVGPAYVSFGSVFFDPDTAADNGVESERGFSVDLSTNSPDEPRFGLLTAPGELSIYNAWVDFWSASTMFIQDGKVWYYDFADANNTYRPYKWKSKVFQSPSKENFEAMKVYFETVPGSPDLNETRYTDINMSLKTDMYGLVRVYADGVLRTAREIRSSGELLRINSGFKAEFWQWEIEARVRIFNLQAATSVKELQRV